MIGVWSRFAAVGLFVVAVAAVALSGRPGPPADRFEMDYPPGPPADRFEVDYPSNPGYGRADPPEGTFVDLSAGATRTCGVRTSGEIECWGDDYGDPPQGRFAKVEVWDAYGPGNACAVAADASVQCWSRFRSGKLLEDTGHDNDYGQDHAPAGAFVDVSVAERFSCGLRIDGSAVCWGDNTGHTYDGFAARWPSGVLEVPAGPFVEVHAGHPPCGLRPDGALVCWSSHAHDVLRPDHSYWDERLVAVSPGWGNTWAYFRGPYWQDPIDFVCGIRPDSTLTCSSHHRDPRGEFVQVDRTAGPVCALRADRSIACWNLTNARSWAELSDPPGGEFTHIAVGAHHACAIRVDGTVACWGENSNKPLPDPCPGADPCPLE